MFTALKKKKIKILVFIPLVLSCFNNNLLLLKL